MTKGSLPFWTHCTESRMLDIHFNTRSTVKSPKSMLESVVRSQSGKAGAHAAG